MELKCQDTILKLLPFAIASVVSVSTCIASDGSYSETHEHVIIKCLPILLLCFFILQVKKFNLTQDDSYSKHVIASLLVSLVGDALLIYKQYFVIGMLCFILAHVFYSNCFGWRPFKFKIALFTYSIAVFTGAFYSLQVNDGIVRYAIPVYCFAIYTMMWRVLARLDKSVSLSSSEMLAFIGALLFVISDNLLGCVKFLTDYANSSLLIMSTYYAAQLFMALSVINKNSQRKDD